MTEKTKNELNLLLCAAKKEPKNDFSVYNSYKNQLSNMDLTGEEYQKAIVKLCRVLEV